MHPDIVDEIENWFEYHPPTGEDQIRAYGNIRKAGKEFALAIARNVPNCADRTAAVRKIREAVMTANAGLACSEEA